MRNDWASPMPPLALCTTDAALLLHVRNTLDLVAYPPGREWHRCLARADIATAVIARDAGHDDAGMDDAAALAKDYTLRTLRLSTQTITLAHTRRQMVEMVGSMIRARAPDTPRSPPRLAPPPVGPLPPADPPADPLARVRVFDGSGHLVGNLGQVACLTNRTVSGAHDEIQTARAIDGIELAFADSGGKPRGAAVRIRRVDFNTDGAVTLFPSAAAAADAAGVDAVTIMRHARNKRRSLINGCAYEFADPPGEDGEVLPPIISLGPSTKMKV